jgi:hypothetical protein
MAHEIGCELETIAGKQNFESLSRGIAQRWAPTGVGEDLVEAVLRFMEEHPEIDYGAPGPLVHLIEGFWNKDARSADCYDRLVVASIERKPTAHTAWLLNRIINVEKDPDRREQFHKVMANAVANPNADRFAREEADNFLKYQISKQS